jgi:hypothetical protein
MATSTTVTKESIPSNAKYLGSIWEDDECPDPSMLVQLNQASKAYMVPLTCYSPNPVVLQQYYII